MCVCVCVCVHRVGVCVSLSWTLLDCACRDSGAGEDWKGYLPVTTSEVCVYVRNRFTARVTELMKVLEDLNNGRYERTMVTTNGPRSESRGTSFLSLVWGQLIGY